MKYIEYNFTKNDFKRAFGFAIDLYMSKGPHTGRTSSEPRGLGAILDAFTRGKLIEIGVKKIFESIEPSKEIILDFDMKSISDVANEPDIISIKENGKERKPKLFIEIKNTGIGDRWIGLTEEQLSTMEKGSAGQKIINVYASLHSIPLKGNPPSSDFVGMYLKSISGLPIFKDFANLNAMARLEFIISVKELNKYGSKFPKGGNLYETNLFPEIPKIRNKDGELVRNIKKIKTYNKFSGKQKVVKTTDGKQDSHYSDFSITGDFTLFRKINEKSQRDYIECHTDTIIDSDIFGRFRLEKDKIYWFNIITVGRDPILKRNNLWIAKRRVYQLIEKGLIAKPNVALKKVVKDI